MDQIPNQDNLKDKDSLSADSGQSQDFSEKESYEQEYLIEQKRILDQKEKDLQSKLDELQQNNQALEARELKLNQKIQNLQDREDNLRQQLLELKNKQQLLEDKLKKESEKKDNLCQALIFEKGQAKLRSSYVDQSGNSLKECYDVFSKDMFRSKLDLPNLGELEVIRHFNCLSKLNFSVDTNFYPLGSCTMKYSPKINDYLAGLDGFSNIHPYQDQKDIQGALKLIYSLGQLLSKITGMERFSLQPSSGAQGELCGLLMIKKFHQSRGNNKTTVIIPDSAHGTNPATVSMCGFKTLVVKSDAKGLVDIDALKSLVDDQTAAIMLTNPNTLGLFEENISDIKDIVHKNGGLLYYDGANFNPLLGITNPALMGFDVVHLNLHKTFSTPHGCGGPGAGVVGVGKKLLEYLPTPLVLEKNGEYYFDYDLKHSIGRLRSFYGNFGVLVRAYAYILRLGKEGLLRVALNSVLNANYIRTSLKDYYQVPFPGVCMHEVVFSCSKQAERGALALDIAKRLIDYDMHPPTMYFPLIVKEALMVEPTETESKETLDYFIATMKKIDKEIDTDIDNLKKSPLTTCVGRVDEVKAARTPDLNFFFSDKKK